MEITSIDANAVMVQFEVKKKKNKNYTRAQAFFLCMHWAQLGAKEIFVFWFEMSIHCTMAS